MQNKISYQQLLPILASFFVMSFIDLIGTGVDEMKKYVHTPSYVLQSIPFIALIWFLILSVPAGILQDKIGKKNGTLLGLLITGLGLVIPVFGNSLAVILLAFAFLGIGNTVLQVAANPLIALLVPDSKKSSILSLSQFIKAIGSMIGPYVAAVTGPWVATMLGDHSPGAWRYALYLFAIVAAIVSFWIWKTDVQVPTNSKSGANFRSCFMMLNNRFVALMVLSIFIVVGFDVSINSNIATYLTSKIGMNEEMAKYGKSMYFFAKMLGSLLGAILLTRIDSNKFLLSTTLSLFFATMLLQFISSEWTAWIAIFLISLSAANIFPIIISLTIQRYPSNSNEISGLIMMAISGGAVIPLFVGIAMESALVYGVGVFFLCSLYLLFTSIYTKRINKYT